MTAQEIQEKIEAALPGATVVVEDPMNDRRHFRAVVIASEFEGLSMVAQHRRVTQAIQTWLGGPEAPIHAFQLSTYTPEQWRAGV